MKRLFDIAFAIAVLIAASPVLLTFIFMVWLEDRHPPFYRAPRVGQNSKMFSMLKIRSMRVGADRSGINSTSNDDNRITNTGAYIRRYKIDELSQFWNVLKGDMSVVGPRPNSMKDGVELYTLREMRLLSIRPGITDIASIVFSDEGAILAGASDPNQRYEELIRPWKSRLGLFYIDHGSMVLDLRIIWLTVLAIFSREKALTGVKNILRKQNCDQQLVEIGSRAIPLYSITPP